jgi:hypothetical protein
MLLYRENRSEDLSIRCYSQVKDTKDAYIVEDKQYGFYSGVPKRLVGVVSDYKCNRYPHLSAPVILPQMGSCYWQGGVFLFVNKTKYDENPVYFQNMIMNYKEQ